MSKCAWCGIETDKPITEFFSHFKLYDHTAWEFLRGNMTTFGWLSGFCSTIFLAFPALSSLWHWRNRKKYLVVDGNQLKVMTN